MKACLPTLLFLLLSFGPVFAASPAEKESSQPNILLLFADDLGRYASAYADPKLPTPNDIVSTPAFDRIAKEGVLATNAFVSVPSCSPCRASLISGRHFFRNGSHSQLHTPWHGDRSTDPWNSVRGFALGLQDAGYHIGWSHKMHIAEDRMGGKKNNYRKAGGKVNRFSQAVSAAKNPDQAKEALYQECRENFRAFLADRKPGQPFYYSFHPTNPHRRWIQGSGKKLWGLDPNELKGKMPSFLPDVPIIREDLADYLGEGMAFDACCEVIIKELKESGELDNTLVVISGDHGAPGFPRGKCNVYDFGSRVLFSARWPGHIKAGQTITKPISLIDLAPTFLAAAGLPPEAGTNGENLLPALATADHSKLRGWALIGRETHVDTARPDQLPYPTRALRTEDHLYIINFNPERAPMGNPLQLDAPTPPTWEEVNKNTRLTYADVDAGPTRTWMLQHREDPKYAEQWKLGFGHRPKIELYDLKSDPHQVTNLADHPEYAKVKKTLHSALMTELEQNNDPRLEGDQFDYPPYTKVGLKK
jgi:N-sulfoglucosamine sulfohydrolase